MMRSAFILACVALCASCIPSAEASPSHAATAAQVAHSAADLGPAWEQNFAVTCGESPTRIQVPGQVFYTCQNSGSTAVYVGGPNLDADTAPCHSSACPSSEWSAHSRRGWCLVASGTVVIKCRALVGQEPAVIVPAADAGVDGGA
jgi:hypothetical protein